MNGEMWEHCTIDRFYGVTKFATLILLSLLISCKLSFMTVGLKISSFPAFALKFPDKIFV